MPCFPIMVFYNTTGGHSLPIQRCQVVGLCSWNSLVLLHLCWDGLLKTQLQHQLGGNTLKSWNIILLETVYTWNQHPTHSAVFPIVKIHESRDHGVEIETITPGDFSVKFHFLFAGTTALLDSTYWFQGEKFRH